MTMVAAQKDCKIAFDLLAKSIAEINNDIRVAENTCLLVFFASLSFSAALCSIFLKSASDLRDNWIYVLGAINAVSAVSMLVAHSTTLKIKAAKERYESIIKIAEKLNYDYVDELLSMVSVTVFRVKADKVQILTPNVRYIFFLTRFLLYGSAIALVANALWLQAQRWRV